MRSMFLLVPDVDEAKELAQEAMVRVYERWDKVSAMNCQGAICTGWRRTTPTRVATQFGALGNLGYRTPTATSSHSRSLFSLRVAPSVATSSSAPT